MTLDPGRPDRTGSLFVGHGHGEGGLEAGESLADLVQGAVVEHLHPLLSGALAKLVEKPQPAPAAEASSADSGQGKGVPTPRPSNQPLVGRRGNWVARFLVFVLMRYLDYVPVPGVVLPAGAEPFVLVVVEVLESVPRRLAGCGAAIFSFPAKI